MFAGWAAALVLVAAPGESNGAPEWSIDTVRAIFVRAEAAARQPDVAAQDGLLAQTAGAAYQVDPRPGESVEAFARRVLLHREPSHPKVKNGQWLSALMSRLYADLGQRTRWLSRTAKDLRERKVLEEKSKQALAASAQIAPTIEIEIAGVEGFLAPLPRFGGSPAAKHGVRAVMRMRPSPECAFCQTIEVDGLDRVTLRDGQLPPDVARTGMGSLREIYSALKLFNTRAQMMAMGFKDAKRDAGKVRAFFPALSSGKYLNEIALAAKEAGSSTMFVMGTDRESGELREIEIALSVPKAKKPRGKKKKAAAPVGVRCKDDENVQVCARRLDEARSGGGPLVFQVDP